MSRKWWKEFPDGAKVVLLDDEPGFPFSAITKEELEHISAFACDGAIKCPICKQQLAEVKETTERLRTYDHPEDISRCCR